MPEKLFDLHGRIIALTGGLGLLGRRYTRALLEAGARVAVLDNAIAAAAQPGEFAGRPCNADLLLVPADVTHRQSLLAANAHIEKIWGPVQGLINNAALDSPPDAPATENGAFETYPESSWDRVLEVNLKGTFLACQVFGGRMAQAGAGSIINIASIYGIVSPDQRLYRYRAAAGEAFYKPVAYAASKSGVLNLTRYLATYWAPRGVRVNTLTLGGVFNNQDGEFLEGYTARVPMGRMARADEYNGAVIFLLSDASSYMTGANLIVDGGWTAW